MEEVSQTMAELGLTPIEIKVLLFLCRTDYATVKDIAKSTEEYRQEIYPALQQLQKQGLIEKRIGVPNHYKALPLPELLRILLERKTNWLSEIQKKTTAQIKKAEIQAPKKAATQPEYEFALITGYEKIGKLLSNWQNPCKTADYVIRFDHFDYQLSERITPHTRYERKEKMKARLVTCIGNIPFGTGDAELRFTSFEMPAEITIFDGKKALMWLLYDRTNVFKKDIAILTSNHPSFVKMLQDYFDMLWENSTAEKRQVKKASTL